MIEIKPKYGKALLRISMSVVFLWFGFSQLYNPSAWTGFVPSFLSEVFNANTLVLINGSFEIVLALFMISGLYVRTSALLLSIHLIGISLSLGYSALAIRDFGLAMATLAVFFFGRDDWCFFSD